MEYNNMTLKDFIEFADIYEYTKDRYDMERILMEMQLISMHIKSYDYLLEHDEVTLNQLDVFMVESGINDKSDMTYQLYIEKSLSFNEGISKLFNMIGKAIASLFKKIQKIFIKENTEVAKLEEINNRQQQQLSDLALLVGATGANNKVQDAINDIDQVASAAHDQLNNIVTHLDKFVGGGGAVCVPVSQIDDKNAIKVITKFTASVTGSKVDDKIIDIYTAFCQKEYEVEGIALIDTLEKITEQISDVIDLSNDKDTSAIAYNSAKKLQLMGPKYIDKINSIKDSIEKSYRTNKRYKLSAEILDAKVATANKLYDIFSKLASYSNIGDVNRANGLKNLFNRLILDNDEQSKNSAEAENNAKIRADKDDDMKFKIMKPTAANGRKMVGKVIKKQEFLNNYPVYLNALHKLAVTLQSATAEMTKALNAHIKMREEVISCHENITGQVDNIINMKQSKTDNSNSATNNAKTV